MSSRRCSNPLRGLVAALTAVLSFFSLAARADAQQTLRIATEGTYYPWSYKDEKGDLIGFDVDIANLLCRQMKLTCTIAAQDWDGIIPALLAGKYDAIVASMAMTPARRERVAFTDKYKDVISKFVARKGTVTDTSPQGLKGKVIAVQRGSSQNKWLDAEGYGATAIVKLYDTTEGPELDLLSGRADLMVGNMVSYYVGFFAKRPEAKDFEFVGPELKGGILGEGAGIALRKSDTELLTKFNAALAAIRADGSYEKLTAKYFPFKLM